MVNGQLFNRNRKKLHISFNYARLGYGEQVLFLLIMMIDVNTNQTE
jgi:hypothetical protein